MMSLSSVIKYTAVVDRRSENAPPPIPLQVALEHAVIKRNYVPPENYQFHIPSRDAYQDELNHLLIDIEDAKAELKELEQQTADYQTEIAALEKERDKLKQYEGLNIEAEIASKINAAEQDAERIRKDADKVLKDAEENARTSSIELVESMKTHGYLDGLEQGANEARQQVRDENKAGIEALAKLTETLSGAKDEIVAENETEIVGLILAVAEKVIGKQLAEDPKAIVDMLKSAMEENRREEYIKVTVSKDLMPIQAKASEQVKKLIEALGQQVDVTIDPDAKPASLLVETAGGLTDLSVGTQLKNIRETMDDAE
jgi:flagellar biosynthesis/type III secretory pathway protein FliH